MVNPKIYFMWSGISAVLLATPAIATPSTTLAAQLHKTIPTPAADDVAVPETIALPSEITRDISQPEAIASPEPTAIEAAPIPVALPTPQLYGEPQPDAIAPPPAEDPLEQFTESEWLALVSDSPTPEPPETPTPIASPTASPALAQITGIDQLSDVQPTDWSYEALRALVEEYGAIEGFPDGTFQGDRPLTRYEFAAALSRALDAVQSRLSNGEDAVEQTDLETLQRLQADFAAELATLNNRVDILESQVETLESQQFSTTMILGGEVTLGLATAGGGDPPGTGDANAVLTYTSNLQLAGSFNGRDALRIGLSAGDFSGRGFANPEVLNTNMALLGYQTDTDNQVELNSLEYRFAVGDRLVFTLKPVGFSLVSVLSPNSIYTSSSQGALSRFGAYNPVFRIGELDSGVGLDFLVSDRARLQIAYGARDGSDPAQGLFDSDHRAFGVQLLARPFRDVTTGIAYVNAFAADGRLDTFTGSFNADTSGQFNEPSAIHAISGTLQWRITPGVVFTTWGGVFVTDSLESDAAALSTTFMFSLGFPDVFGREGDLLAVMVGQSPRLREGLLIEREDEGSAMHYEAFYRFRLDDNVAIAPGFFIVTQPGHIEENNTIFVGAIRTVFTF